MTDVQSAMVIPLRSANGSVYAGLVDGITSVA